MLSLTTQSCLSLSLPPHSASFRMAALFSAVAVEDAALMMMTGSLKQAKCNALPRGLIICTNLALIRLLPPSVYLFLSLCLLFSSSFLWSDASFSLCLFPLDYSFFLRQRRTATWPEKLRPIPLIDVGSNLPPQNVNMSVGPFLFFRFTIRRVSWNERRISCF